MTESSPEHKTKLRRRDFLKLLGGAAIVAVQLGVWNWWVLKGRHA